MEFESLPIMGHGCHIAMETACQARPCGYACMAVCWLLLATMGGANAMVDTLCSGDGG